MSGCAYLLCATYCIRYLLALLFNAVSNTPRMVRWTSVCVDAESQQAIFAMTSESGVDVDRDNTFGASEALLHEIL